jgi:hypothetical protein
MSKTRLSPTTTRPSISTPQVPDGLQGRRLTKLIDCEFFECAWTCDDAAARTVAFMKAMYHGGGSGGKELFEDTFRKIRGG